VIPALAGKHFPVIKALHLPVEVDLSHHRSLVAVLLEDLLHLRLTVIERLGSPVRVFVVHVAVLAGQQRRATGRTDRVGHIRAFEDHALRGQPVEVGREVQRLQTPAVGPNRLRGVIIGEDPKDVRPRPRRRLFFTSRRLTGAADNAQTQHDNQQRKLLHA
jgi:hypothetical protein